MNKNKKNEVANKKKKQTIVAEKQRKPGIRASICRKVELFNLPSLVCFEQLIE